MIKSVTTNHDSIVKGYQDTFNKLLDTFRHKIISNTGLEVVQIYAKTEEMLSQPREINMEQLLEQLPYAANQGMSNPCLPGTRGEIIADILGWLSASSENHSNVQRMYWLHGVAGFGKSTVAKSVAEALEISRRCVSFYFSASKQAEAGPHNLFSILSWDLAGKNNAWKLALVDAIRESPKARKGGTVEEQFESLMMKPSGGFDNFGPILIIIDAIDECGSPKERESVLRALNNLLRLPDQFRFLVTSRTEEDILESFMDQGQTFIRRLDNIDKQSTNHDIGLYVENRLRSVRVLNDNWDDAWIGKIIEHSSELFQWAFTACEYIKGTPRIGNNSLKQLKFILQSGGFNGLDGLYLSILGKLSSFKPGDPDHRLFVTVMGRILSLFEPLSLQSLSELHDNDEDKDSVKTILSPLGSLIRGVDGGNEPVQPLHASFIDFLLDKSWSGKYHVELEVQKMKIPRTLLREMQSNLEFNICKIETSYKLNRDIENLEHQVKRCIPAHVAYACRFWGDHIGDLPATDECKSAVDTFFRTKFLFWLEVLSVTKRAKTSSAQISKVQNWAAQMEDDRLKDFLGQAKPFIFAFEGVIEQSVPHIYLSALHFVPRSSAISKAFMNDFRDPIDSKFHKIIQWPMILLNINLQLDVRCIAFSPNGDRIVSGSEDKTVRIWNTRTGELEAGLFQGHDSGVASVAFSPDGDRIVSGSHDKTVRIWNACTGKLAAGPFRGHKYSVTSVAFSPDGDLIVSGSRDYTVLIWNTRTGKLAAGPFKGHDADVTSVAFSPDGDHIVFGSHDKTVRIWDARTSELAAGPFQGHGSLVTAVAFSPNGDRIVSGSHDKTVRIWNAGTGELAAGPFQGHDSNVNSVAFSPNGDCIVSGSSDETIRIWQLRNQISNLSHSANYKHDLSLISMASSLLRPQATQSFIENTAVLHSNNNAAALYTNQSKFNNGWMYDPKDELLFWVPPDYRSILQTPNVVIISRKSMRYDFSNIAHGTSWTQNYHPQSK